MTAIDVFEGAGQQVCVSVARSSESEQVPPITKRADRESEDDTLGCNVTIFVSAVTDGEAG